ncbi:MAG: VapC toxin family PIN domain ribonuclease [Bacteroidetes bacterium 4484_276]|nr:MAG: VapC toxin family PIN domain ribonuclease [Bacteroidetes bacterium 4484_276]
MKKYLLDTNICIYYIQGKFSLKEKFRKIKKGNRFISEITLAELKFGVKNSQSQKKNQETLDNFLIGIQILPIINSLDIYAEEKARLRKQGRPIDDFDLLIGASAIANNMILVTNNESHFQRITNITIENWTKNH